MKKMIDYSYFDSFVAVIGIRLHHLHHKHLLDDQYLDQRQGVVQSQNEIPAKSKLLTTTSVTYIVDLVGYHMNVFEDVHQQQSKEPLRVKLAKFQLPSAKSHTK